MKTRYYTACQKNTVSDLGLDPHQLIPIVGLSIGCATHTLSSFLEFATLYCCRFYGCNVPAVFFHLLRPLLVPSWKNMVRRWEFGVLSIVWHSIVCWSEYVRILIFTYIYCMYLILIVLVHERFSSIGYIVYQINIT